MISVVSSTIRHAKELSDNIREKDRQEALAFGVDPRKGVFFAYRSGLWRRTILVDDRVAAMAGVAGCPLSLKGQPYLITSPVAEEVSPFQFTRVYKQEVSLMKQLFPILENYVDATYAGAVRMLRIAGFTLEGPMPVPPYDKPFYKFSMSS